MLIFSLCYTVIYCYTGSGAGSPRSASGSDDGSDKEGSHAGSDVAPGSPGGGELAYVVSLTAALCSQ